MSFVARPKKKYNPNPPLDRDALHRYLWERAHPNSHRIPVHQGQLADALGVTRGTIVRVLNELVEQGRMRKVDSKDKNVRVLQIIDPDVWNGSKAPEPRKILWS